MVETEGRRKGSKDTDHSKLKDLLMNNGELHTHTPPAKSFLFTGLSSLILYILLGGRVFPRSEGTKHGHDQTQKMVTFSLPSALGYILFTILGTISLAGYFP